MSLWYTYQTYDYLQVSYHQKVLFLIFLSWRCGGDGLCLATQVSSDREHKVQHLDHCRSIIASKRTFHLLFVQLRNQLYAAKVLSKLYDKLETHNYTDPIAQSQRGVFCLLLPERGHLHWLVSISFWISSPLKVTSVWGNIFDSQAHPVDILLFCITHFSVYNVSSLLYLWMSYIFLHKYLHSQIYHETGESLYGPSWARLHLYSLAS